MVRNRKFDRIPLLKSSNYYQVTAQGFSRVPLYMFIIESKVNDSVAVSSRIVRSPFSINTQPLDEKVIPPQAQTGMRFWNSRHRPLLEVSSLVLIG